MQYKCIEAHIKKKLFPIPCEYMWWAPSKITRVYDNHLLHFVTVAEQTCMLGSLFDNFKFWFKCYRESKKSQGQNNKTNN